MNTEVILDLGKETKKYLDKFFASEEFEEMVTDAISNIGKKERFEIVENLYEFYLDGTKQPICRVQCGPMTLHAILDYYLNKLDSEGFHCVGSVTIKGLWRNNETN